jgi:hypothetical protein
VNIDGAPLTPADLAPQAAALVIDPAQLVTRTDSFQIMVQGNPMGSQVNRLFVSADSVVYVENTNIGGFVLQDSRLDFAPATWEVRDVRQSGTMQGQKFETTLSYAAGRVKGSAQTPQPGGTPKTVTVDTALLAGTIDDNALSVLLPALALEVGKTLTVTTFSGGRAASQVMTVKVGAPESVTVPAGTFEAFKVDLTGGQAPVTMWITVAGPRRIVKIAPGGAPIVIELVK